MKKISKVFCNLAFTVTFATAFAAGQVVPVALTANSSGNTGAAPNGIAVVPGQLLFTQPFCSGAQARAIYQENIAAGTSSLLSAIPDVPGKCAENYLAISTGLGGFKAGDTFVTGASTTNSANSEVFKNGSTPFIDGITNSQNHVGITFDTAGTFGFNLIVTAQGSVTGYDPTGAVKFTYSGDPRYVLEGATVAPLTYAPCPGCLYMTATPSPNVNNPNPATTGAIFFVTPGTPSGSAITLWSTTPGAVEPEGLVFVGNNLSCSLAGANGAAYSYFVSGYATGAQKEDGHATNGAILAWSPASLAPYAGQFLVPDEQGTIFAFSGPNMSTPFATTGYQLEASTILSCPSGGCPATMGFWKHHAFPSSMFVGGTTSIGCMNYSSSELLAILNKNNAGGNAVTILGHQLIAAIANYDAGAAQTPTASAAIASAITLLCTNGINLSSGFVQSSSTLGQQMTALANTLDQYNSSAPTCEGTGLTVGSK